MTKVPEKRRLIPKEYTVSFKTLFHGLEVHAVLGERVLVDEIEPFTEHDAVNQRLAEAGTAIYAPEQYYQGETKRSVEKPTPCAGIVIALGNGVSDEMKAMGLEEGAAVCFGAHNGTPYFIGGTKFRILDVKEILAILRAKDEHRLDEVIGPVKTG